MHTSILTARILLGFPGSPALWYEIDESGLWTATLFVCAVFRFQVKEWRAVDAVQAAHLQDVAVDADPGVEAYAFTFG